MCLDDPVLAGTSPSLEALPRRMAEFIGTMPGCMGAVDTRAAAASRWASAPVGIPRCSLVLVRLSRSLEKGRGDSATNTNVRRLIDISPR